VPHDCVDGFYHAFWRRPHAYLDPAVRSNVSVFHLLGRDDVRQASTRCAPRPGERDVAAPARGAPRPPELDLGLRLVVAQDPAMSFRAPRRSLVP
jgi:hypothetical protein